MMSRLVTFLAVVASVIAHAETYNDFTTLEITTRQHCQLFIEADAHTTPNLTRPLDGGYYPPEARYAYQPDFGFLMPNQWPALGWHDRTRFNHAVTRYIKREMQLDARLTLPDECTAQLRMTTIETDDDTPERQAIAIMHTKQAPTITYLFADYPQQGWLMTDMHLYQQSLTDMLSQKSQRIHAQHGMDALIKHLAQ